MILQLKHEPVGGGVPQFVSEVSTGRNVIGRDDQNALVLDIESVSREHACFFEARGRWFFSDLGSTNGSWVNGQKSTPTSIRLLRDGDLVQLANVALRVTLTPSEDQASEVDEVPSLFVFQEGEFKMEFPLASSASRFALQDLANFLTLGHFEKLPAMTVSFRPGKLELVVASEDARVLVNGVEWGGSSGSGRTLYDRDELDSGSIKVVIVDLNTAKTAKDRQIKAALASLPPAPGGINPAQGGFAVEATQALPRVSSQGEPSATMGSGSGLFGAGRPPSGPASAAEGRFSVQDGENDQSRKKAPRYVFGTEGEAEVTQPGTPPRRQTVEIAVAQRFGAPPPVVEEETSEPRASKAYMLIGIVALALVVVLISVLVQMFRNG